MAQLVRAPPCHGGGRGFESRLGRSGSLAQLGEGIAGWLEVTADGMQIVSYEKMKLPQGMKNGA